MIWARTAAADRRPTRSAPTPRGAPRSPATARPRSGAADPADTWRLAARGAEIDWEERRRAVQQLEPARVDLRRQMMPLRIVDVRSELGVVIEVPARELRGRDPARHRVGQPSARSARGRRFAKTARCTTSCSSTVKLKTVNPWTNARGIQMAGERIAPGPRSPSRTANCRAPTSRCRRRGLLMQFDEHRFQAARGRAPRAAPSHAD